jgi:hypothetical protein
MVFPEGGSTSIEYQLGSNGDPPAVMYVTPWLLELF